MGKSYKTELAEARKVITEREGEIKGLGDTITGLRTDIQTKEGEQTDLEGELETSETEKKELSDKNEALAEKLRTMELSRFASAYAVQEMEYEQQQDRWFKLSIWATVFLTLSALGSIFGLQFFADKPWYSEPGFYVLNFIFITLFVYSLKQHAHFGNLRIDYGNRKALAQSYQHIVSDEEELAGIKVKFLERAAEIFSSRALFRSSDVTPHESLLSRVFGKKEE